MTNTQKETAKRRAKAIGIFVAVFAIAFVVGMKYSSNQSQQVPANAKINPNDPSFTVYECSDDKSIWASYKESEVSLSLSDGSTIFLPQATSGSGARFANEDESIVFWDKGGSAFLEQNGEKTYDGCEKRDRGI